MATMLEKPRTVAELLARLAAPPERVLLEPRPGTATEEDLLDQPRLCELIDGVLVEKTMGFFESRWAVTLNFYMELYLDENPIGFTLNGSGMCRVNPEQVRLPDASFFSWDHFPGKSLPTDEAILDRSPDLAVEILSRGNTKAEMERKRHEYFAAGTKIYWEVDPRKRIAKVYTSVNRHKVVDEEGTLSGGVVLPGFSLAMRTWWEKAEKRGR